MIKFLYSISKVGNYWFAIYPIHYKEKLEINEFLYDLCFFYSFSSFDIIKMQIYNIKIFIKNNFASKKKAIIKSAKIMIKDQQYFTFL